MNFFGLGLGELVFLLLLGFILLGPEDMHRAARLLGRGLRWLYTSTLWRMSMRVRYEMEQYIREEIRRAGLDDLEREFQEWKRTQQAWQARWQESVTASQQPVSSLPVDDGRTIHPPETLQEGPGERD